MKKTVKPYRKKKKSFNYREICNLDPDEIQELAWEQEEKERSNNIIKKETKE